MSTKDILTQQQQKTPWPCSASELYRPQKLALTSATGGGLSVGILIQQDA
jgi:hypothetical protein